MYSPSGTSRYSAGEEQAVHCPSMTCPSRTAASMHSKENPAEEPLAPTPNSKDITSLFVTSGGPLVMTALTTGQSSWFCPGPGATSVPAKSPLTTREYGCGPIWLEYIFAP